MGHLNAGFWALSLRFLSLRYFTPQIPSLLTSLNSISALISKTTAFFLGSFHPCHNLEKALRKILRSVWTAPLCFLFWRILAVQYYLHWLSSALKGLCIYFSNFKLFLVEDLVQHKLHCWVQGQKFYRLNFNFNNLFEWHWTSFLNVVFYLFLIRIQSFLITACCTLSLPFFKHFSCILNLYLDYDNSKIYLSLGVCFLFFFVCLVIFLYFPHIKWSQFVEVLNWVILHFYRTCKQWIIYIFPYLSWV